MNRFLILLLLVSGILPQSKKAVITLYNDGYGLIRQPVSFQVQIGLNNFSYPDLPARIEPGSVFLSISEGTIIKQKYNNNVYDTFSFLNSSLGTNVTLKMKGSKSVKGRLIDVDNRWLSVKSKNQVHVLNMSEVIEVVSNNKISNLSIAPSMEWEIKSAAIGKINGEIVYISGGFVWNANYRLIIFPDEKQGILITQAEVSNNTTQDFIGASLQLVEGDLRRRRNNGSSQPRIALQTERKNENGFNLESSGDFVLYTLSEPLALPKNESITVSLYSDAEVKLDRTYVFENEEKVKSEQPLSIEISFTNREQNLDVPLPAGILQIYQRTDNKGIIFAGEDFLPQTATGEDVTVVAGRAFNVIGKRTVMNYDRKKKSEEATILLELNNKRKDDINIRLIEHIFGDWVIKDPSHDYRKVDSETIQFDIIMKGSSSETVTYTYRKEWQ